MDCWRSWCGAVVEGWPEGLMVDGWLVGVGAQLVGGRVLVWIPLCLCVRQACLPCVLMEQPQSLLTLVGARLNFLQYSGMGPGQTCLATQQQSNKHTTPQR